ncbi:RING finger protein 227 [Microcaecilia unicolor]|uniref:RING finger protein 227 n=1 Tax=Microcaecilia unicolor TaxID=1415580 RepID=A0A6P7WS25_9AMPH|nr:RING finger protein 227 [Microcaecilia unicolor]
MEVEDSECPVCYRSFDRQSRAPRRLGRCLCPHALCTRCLQELAARWPAVVACPFCRAPAPLPAGGVTALPLDLGIWERLAAEKEEEEDGGCDKDTTDRGKSVASKRSFWKAARGLWRKALCAPARSTRRPAIDPKELRDLALMNCYIM